mmetsp:Transcript_19838/g.31525  ORF Transcript_19838/g.31525 Transcript_19838/m.31525 type:complete len:200 (-) Transcript_19838:77-676(-)|eukprot:jgi/Bigna1/133846/aug1.22_g8554
MKGAAVKAAVWVLLVTPLVTAVETEMELAYFKAATKGDLEKVKQLLKEGQVTVDHLNEHGESALFLACEMGHEKIVDFILGGSISLIDFKTKYGRTPLWMASRNGHNSIVRLLVANAHIEEPIRHFYSVLVTLGIAKDFVQLAESFGIEDDDHLKYLSEENLAPMINSLTASEKKKFRISLLWMQKHHNQKEDKNRDEL